MALIVGFMLLIFIVFFLVIGNKMIDAKQDVERRMLVDLANVIKTEIDIAASVSDGYCREFTLPAKIEGIDYSIELYPADKELILSFVGHGFDYEYVAFTPENVQQGSDISNEETNVIRKEQGNVQISFGGSC